MHISKLSYSYENQTLHSYRHLRCESLRRFGTPTTNADGFQAMSPALRFELFTEDEPSLTMKFTLVENELGYTFTTSFPLDGCILQDASTFALSISGTLSETAAYVYGQSAFEVGRSTPSTYDDTATSTLQGTASGSWTMPTRDVYRCSIGK